MSALVLYAAPTTEPLTVAEASVHAKLDAANVEPSPGIITAALASPAVAGNVTAGAHRYRATFVTATGETDGGVISASVTVADAAVNGKVELTAIPIGGALVTSRKIYRTAANGTAYLLLTTIANNTATTYTDNIADASLGAGIPSTNTTDDPYVTGLIKAARVRAEAITRRALITQTWDLILDNFPSWELTLPKPTLQSVTSISYVDTNGTTQTLAADQYRVDISNEPARITPAFGLVWPSTRYQTGAVTIRFVAGYGAASAVPDGIKLWMMMRIKHFVENGGPVQVGGQIAEFPRSYVDGLLDDFSIRDYGWAGE